MTVLATAVQSRQRNESFKLQAMPQTGLLAAAQTVVTNAIRATGYNAVVGVIISDQPGTVTVFAAPGIPGRAGKTRPGIFLPLGAPIATITATDMKGVTWQVAFIDIEVQAEFIQIQYLNGTGNQKTFQFAVSLQSIFGFKNIAMASGQVVSVSTANRPTFTTGQLRVAAPGTAQNLPGTPIPDGFGLVLKAKKANAGLVYIGPTQVAAQAHTTAYSMASQETIKYFLKNTNAVWVDADNANEGIDWTVEQ